MRRAVAALPLRQRTALVLRYYSDLSVQETADAMACAAGTVTSLTSQAIAALRTARHLDDLGELAALRALVRDPGHVPCRRARSASPLPAAR